MNILEPFRSVPRILNDYPILAATTLALAIRLNIVLTADFPLNDGGLFYTMTQEIQSSKFQLPLYTSYNNSQIPFAYPLLSFYIAAILDTTFPVSLITIFRFLPFIVSLLTVPAFYLVGREILGKNRAVLATFVFVLFPRSFIWIIMGGGLARSWGLLFCLLAIFFGIKFYKTSLRSNLVLASIFLSLTLLSHLEWYFFAILSLIVLSFIYRKLANSLTKLLQTTIFSLILASPWWLTILLRHGFEPLIAFSQAGFSITDGSSYLQLIAIHVTDEPFLTIWGVLILLGIMISIFEKKLLYIVWFLIPIIVAPRSSPNLVIIPATILITNSIFGVILPSIARTLKVRTLGLRHLVKPLAAKVFFAFVTFYFLVSINGIVFIDTFNYFAFATMEEHNAFEWIRQNTEPNDRFLLLTENKYPSWGMDPISEWFPALAERQSIMTPQGSEWLPENKFLEKVGFYTQIKSCYDKNLACVENVAQNYDNFTHIYLYKPTKDDKDNLPLIRHELVNSEKYSIVYENSRVSIFSKKNYNK